MYKFTSIATVIFNVTYEDTTEEHETCIKDSLSSIMLGIPLIEEYNGNGMSTVSYCGEIGNTEIESVCKSLDDIECEVTVSITGKYNNTNNKELFTFCFINPPISVESLVSVLLVNTEYEIKVNGFGNFIATMTLDTFIINVIGSLGAELLRMKLMQRVYLKRVRGNRGYFVHFGNEFNV